MAASDLLPDDEVRTPARPLSDQDGPPLSPAETAQIDQMEAGLAHDSISPTPTHTPNTPPQLKKKSAAGAVISSSANPAGLAMRLTGFGKRHKKGLVAGGGGAGLIILLLAGFLALIPLKAAHFLKIITDKRFGSMQTAIESRAEKHVANFLEGRLTGVDFNTGSNNATLIVGGSLTKDLYHNWQTAKFEDKLAKDYGITFSRDARFGSGAAHYTVLQHGNPIARDVGGGTLTSIGNNEFRSVIDNAVKNETHWWSYTQRRHIRAAVYQRWKVSKWFLFPKTREKAKEKLLDVKKNTLQAMIDHVVKPISSKYADYFSCIIDDGCNLDSKPSGLDPAQQKDKAKSGAQQQLKDGNAQAHIDSSIDSKLDDALNKTATAEADKLSDTVFLDKIRQVMTNEIVTTVVKWAGAGLGLLELISKLNHALEPGGAVDKIIADRNTEQFGNYFSVVASGIDQLKSGDLTSLESGVFLARFNGIEQSRVYRKQYAGETGVDNTTYCGGKDVTQNGKTYHQGGYKLDSSQLVCPDKKVSSDGGVVATIRTTPFYSLIHTIAGVYDDTAGGVVSWFNDLTSAVFSAVGLDDLANFVTDQVFNAVKGITGFDTKAAIAQGLNDAMDTFFSATVTGTEVGADLFNAVDAGADLVGNQFAKAAGGILLSPTQLLEYQKAENTRIAQASNGWHGYWYKIASIDNVNSIASKLITWAPLNASDGARKMSAAFADWLNPTTWPAKLAFAGSIAMPGSHQVLAAANEPDPYGVAQWGFDLNQVRSAPLTDPASPECQAEIATINANATSSNYKPNKASLCMLDKIAIQDLNANFTNQDDGGLQAQIAEDGAGASTNTGSATLSGTGNARILEAALKYDNYQYAQGGNVGHGDIVGWVNRCDSGPSSSCKLDCSGLVNVAVYKAFGVVQSDSSESIMNNKNWQRIPNFPQYASDLKPGDVVRRFGHIAIVQSYDIHTNTLTIFEAATAHTDPANQIRSKHFTPPGNFTDALRYIGPGAAQ